MSFSLKGYTHIRFLKKGGQATLYRAIHESLMREVVLKIYPSKDVQEARLSASLEHPGLVTVYDYGEDSNVFYLSMEYLCGCTLQDWPKENSLSLECKVHLGLQLVEVLRFLHKQEVVHGDLSAGNVFVTEKGVIKVLDLGMSIRKKKIAGSSNKVQTSSELSGTLPYMPPEFLSGRAQKTLAGDVYSLALVLAEVFMEKPVLQEPNKKKLLEQIQQGSWDLDSSIPNPLREVLGLYLIKDPTKRPITLQPLQEALESMALAPFDTQIQKVLKDYAMGQEKEEWKKYLEELEKNKQWDVAFAEIKSRMAEYPHETEWLATLQRVGEYMNTVPSQREGSRVRYLLIIFLLCILGGGGFLVWNENSSKKSSLIQATDQSIGKKWFPSKQNSKKNSKLLEKQSGLWGTLVFPDLPKSYAVFLNGKRVREYHYVSTSRWIQWKQGKYFLQVKSSTGQEVYQDSLSLYSSEPIRVLW